MDSEQRTNAERLEKIAEELRKIARKINSSGYLPSVHELGQLEIIKKLSQACLYLAKK